jgi:chemotaxis protein MotA
MALFFGGLFMGLMALLSVIFLEGGSIGSLLVPSAILCAILGPLGPSMMGIEKADMKNVPKTLKIALTGKAPDPDEVVTLFGRFAERARKEGMLALESELPSVTDHFMRTGLQLVVDGVDGDHVREVLEAELEAVRDRHGAMIKFWGSMSGFAPIFGLMGTILGIIGVMGKLASPEELGPGIAIALCGVFMGVLWGNLIYLPIANKLTRLHELEMEVRHLALEGVMAVREGMSARLLVERLEAYLSPQMRVGHQKRSGRSTDKKAVA